MFGNVWGPPLPSLAAWGHVVDRVHFIHFSELCYLCFIKTTFMIWKVVLHIIIVSLINRYFELRYQSDDQVVRGWSASMVVAWELGSKRRCQMIHPQSLLWRDWGRWCRSALLTSLVLFHSYLWFILCHCEIVICPTVPIIGHIEALAAVTRDTSTLQPVVRWGN